MASKDYEDKLCEAIEYIVDKAVLNAGFDRTIQATVIECIDKTIGKYKIKYQDSSFLAYTESTNTSYSKGTSVYVLIPGNDMSQHKTILGSTDKLGVNYISNPEGEDVFDMVGTNCIESDKQIELCTYEPNSIIELYNRETGIDEINIEQSEEKINIYLQQSSALLIGATCRTNIEPEAQRRGTYGIVYELIFKDNTGSGKEILRQYTFNTNQMKGQPLNYTLDNRQYSIFELDGENFIRINRVYVYQQNFPIKEENKDTDIFIKNLELFGCNALTAEQLAGCALTISTPQGGFFDKEKPQDSLKLQANVRIKGQFIDKNSQDIDYYWFVEDVRVDSSNPNYNQYGGFGWRCLNESNPISGDDNLREWVAASYEYLLKRDPDALAKINKIKCVALYNDTIVSGTVDIYNRNANYDFNIDIDTLNKSTTFYFDVGTPTIKCLVNGEENNDYDYYWIKIDSKNNSLHLENTTEDNNNYNNYNQEYNELIELVTNTPEVAESNKEQIEKLLTKLKDYDTIMRVEGNTIHKIQISEINLFNIFKCGILKDGKYLGTASITISNVYELGTGYSLILNNATQVFKYDANGISPMSKGLENSIEQTTLPLSYTLYDAQGNDITNDMKNNFEVEWIVPVENTMLSFPDSYEFEEMKQIQEENEEQWGVVWNEKRKDYKFLTIKDEDSLSFNIADKYNIGYGNNTIQLKLRFKELFFTVNSNLTFAKDGEPGTNGTDFVCKIIPNTEKEIPMYPMLTTIKGKNNPTLNYTLAEKYKWFKVQLWHSGVKIFEGYSDGVSTEGYEIKNIKWEILKNNYGTVKDENGNNVIVTEESDIIIDDDTTGDFSAKNYNLDIENKANIIKCSLKYKDVVYFATMPMITSYITESKYEVKLKDNTGFLHAVYSTDGKKPQYNSANPFELIVTKSTGDYKENVSNATSSDEHLDYLWDYRGHVYRFANSTNAVGIWKKMCFIEETSSNDGSVNPKSFKPTDYYDGECVSNALVCIIKRTRDSKEVGRIHIPIHLLLNKYGQSALNNWDGNSISIDEDQGYILSPQMGAGEKDEENRFTGVLMGKVQEAGKTIQENGLFGYHQGTRSFHLNSKNGAAIFGKSKLNSITVEKVESVYDKDGGKVGTKKVLETNNQLGGQVIIDPSSGKALLYSSNFFANYNEDGLPKTNYTYSDSTHKYNGQAYENKQTITEDNESDYSEAGALIDLSTPRILWGNGNFRVEPNGFLYAKGGGQIAGWKINDYRIDSIDNGTDSTKTGKTGISSVYTLKEKDGSDTIGVTKWKVYGPGNDSEGTDRAIAFWAGKKAYNSDASKNVDLATFYVTHDGYLRAQEGTIGSGSKDSLIYVGKSIINENGTTKNYSALYTLNKTTLHSSGNGFYIGTDGIGLGKLTKYEKQTINTSTNIAETIDLGNHSMFEVHSDGTLYAKNGYFNGEVYSNIGTIGGWYITSNGLQKLRKDETSPFVTFGRTSNDGDPSKGRVLEVKDSEGNVRLYIDETGKLGGKGVNLGGNIDISSGSIIIENGNNIFKVDGSTSKMTSNSFAISNGSIDKADITNGTIDKAAITNGTMKKTALEDVSITSSSIQTKGKYSSFRGRLINGTYIGSQGRIIDDGTAAGIYFGTRSGVGSTAEGAYIGKEGISFKIGSINYSFDSTEPRVNDIPRIYWGSTPGENYGINNNSSKAKTGDIFIKWY